MKSRIVESGFLNFPTLQIFENQNVASLPFNVKSNGQITGQQVLRGFLDAGICGFGVFLIWVVEESGIPVFNQKTIKIQSETLPNLIQIPPKIFPSFKTFPKSTPNPSRTLPEPFPGELLGGGGEMSTKFLHFSLHLGSLGLHLGSLGPPFLSPF